MTKAIGTVVFAAAVAVSAGTASAEWLKASVPFEFTAGQKNMPAGEYLVETRSRAGANVNFIRHEASHKSVFLLTQNSLAPVSRHRLSLVFRCVGSDCALAQIWPGAGTPGAQVLGSGGRRTARDREARNVAITLTSANAE